MFSFLYVCICLIIFWYIKLKILWKILSPFFSLFYWEFLFKRIPISLHFNILIIYYIFCLYRNTNFPIGIAKILHFLNTNWIVKIVKHYFFLSVHKKKKIIIYFVFLSYFSGCISSFSFIFLIVILSF